MMDVDVVIVGAGCAGLAAARRLRAERRRFAVVEAMHRIGGRAWTMTTDSGVPFDIGCAWVHAAGRNPFCPEAQAAGWTLHHHDWGLDHLWFAKRRATPEEMERVAAADAALQACLEAHEVPYDRLSDLIADCHCLQANSTFAGPMDFGADHDEISIADHRAAADLDRNSFTKEGYGALIHRWRADVPVARFVASSGTGRG
ncbi:FAD-dependent oxidoreductase [Tabrizicola sp. YIM 78059]|uniref:FAD-dependent oxidoreductase n=1 Tax=Tabrizicola sp. YIM 78059 TaxID=2529861 RepID=UPI001B7D7E3A|nr:FAD-dependent oxidoreductase [Tabrizicola sp. YIM 78059]